MTNQQFDKLLESAPKNANIQKYMMSTRSKLSEYRRIAISYSGGSDSDIMLDLIELVKPKDCGEIRYVFFDTGLEWDSTLRHVSEMQRSYNVTIECHKAKVPIPAACSKHGVPFKSKDVSANLYRLQCHNFDWNETLDGATEEKYGKCKSALDWYYDRRDNSKRGKSLYSIERYRLLRQFMQCNPPDFMISDKCCDYAKKNVAKEFNLEYRPDLCINGMRQAEGGRRAGSVKNCFTPFSYKKSYAEYRPMWFWSDKDKQIYKDWRSIRYSDCYEVWGFNRTGCVGCPCSSNSVKQLQIAEAFEPNKVKAAYAIFGKSYEYSEKYNRFRAEWVSSEFRQLSWFDETYGV